MTLLPTDTRDVKGVAAERYPLNKVDAKPGSFEDAVDAHHCFRRSAIGNDSWFVSIDGEDPIPHVVGLSRASHDEVTSNEAWIKYEDGVFVWYERDLVREIAEPEWRRVGPLDPQPGQLYKSEKKKKRAYKGEKARNRTTWSVRVPKDAQEDGIEVLKTLVELAAEKIPGRDADTPPYYILVEALSIFVLEAVAE